MLTTVWWQRKGTGGTHRGGVASCVFGGICGKENAGFCRLIAKLVNSETRLVNLSARNDVVERGVQAVQEEGRFLKSAVEIDTPHSVWPWLVEFCVFLGSQRWSH